MDFRWQIECVLLSKWFIVYISTRQKNKGEFANFIIGLSDAPKYDIIWTKNENLIERQYLWKEAINHIAVFSPNTVILRGVRKAYKNNWWTLLLNNQTLKEE